MRGIQIRTGGHSPLQGRLVVVVCARLQPVGPSRVHSTEMSSRKLSFVTYFIEMNVTQPGQRDRTNAFVRRAKYAEQY